MQLDAATFLYEFIKYLMIFNIFEAHLVLACTLQ